jgi:hypothetical protein
LDGLIPKFDESSLASCSSHLTHKANGISDRSAPTEDDSRELESRYVPVSPLWQMIDHGQLCAICTHTSE